jgi:hypothetical protein
MLHHSLQGGKDTIHGFIGIDENDDDWRLATSLCQARGLDTLSSWKSGDTLDGSRRVDILFAQVGKNLQAQ